MPNAGPEGNTKVNQKIFRSTAIIVRLNRRY